MIHWFTTRVPLVLFSPPVPLPRAVKIPENNSTWKSPFECGSSRLSQSPQIHTTWPSMTCESYRKWLATFALLLNMQKPRNHIIIDCQIIFQVEDSTKCFKSIHQLDKQVSSRILFLLLAHLKCSRASSTFWNFFLTNPSNTLANTKGSGICLNPRSDARTSASRDFAILLMCATRKLREMLGQWQSNLDKPWGALKDKCSYEASNIGVVLSCVL